MNELKSIIETIITNEIQQDKGVVADGYTLAPISMVTELKGDGEPQEIGVNYQLDFFYKSKGQLVAKAKALVLALSDYPLNDLVFTWEETARLWRATVLIETI